MKVSIVMTMLLSTIERQNISNVNAALLEETFIQSNLIPNKLNHAIGST